MTHEHCQADSNLCCRVMNGDIVSVKYIRRTGAKGVVTCFSFASMRTASTRKLVINISMKTACALLIPGPG